MFVEGPHLPISIIKNKIEYELYKLKKTYKIKKEMISYTQFFLILT